jgi:hypothetical protein
MSAFTRKPVIVAELATNKDGGDKPAWIENGYPAVYNKFSRIKGINYLNVDLRNVGHPDWSLNTPRPEAMQAYSDVVRDPRFQGEY